MFEIAVAVLVVLALLFCWPLWRFRAAPRASAKTREAQRKAYNADLYQDFAQELEEDLTLDASSKEALLADKARQLLDDTAGGAGQDTATEPQTSTALSAGMWARIAALVVIVAGSGVTYWQLGTPGAHTLEEARDILSLPSLAEVDGDETDPSVQKLRRLVGQLRGQVQRDPDGEGSWYLLGIGELKLQAYSAAADAFESAHKLVGADANLDLYWLQARLLADKGTLTEATQAIAQRVLATQPNQPMVLNMLALAAFRSSDYATAVGYLNSALSNNLTEGQREMLASGFAQARESLGVVGPTVDVALDVTGAPPADAVLFVIARPVGGGMPYAVVRRPVSGVPQRVRLDDAVSMNPANPLSAAEEIEVIARVSLTGRPQAGPGDWQWQSPPLTLSGDSEPIRLEARLASPGAAGQG